MEEAYLFFSEVKCRSLDLFYEATTKYVEILRSIKGLKVSFHVSKGSMTHDPLPLVSIRFT